MPRLRKGIPEHGRLVIQAPPERGNDILLQVQLHDQGREGQSFRKRKSARRRAETDEKNGTV